MVGEPKRPDQARSRPRPRWRSRSSAPSARARSIAQARRCPRAGRSATATAVRTRPAALHQHQVMTSVRAEDPPSAASGRPYQRPDRPDQHAVGVMARAIQPMIVTSSEAPRSAPCAAAPGRRRAPASTALSPEGGVHRSGNPLEEQIIPSWSRESSHLPLLLTMDSQFADVPWRLRLLCPPPQGCPAHGRGRPLASTVLTQGTPSSTRVQGSQQGC